MVCLPCSLAAVPRVHAAGLRPGPDRAAPPQHTNIPARSAPGQWRWWSCGWRRQACSRLLACKHQAPKRQGSVDLGAAQTLPGTARSSRGLAGPCGGAERPAAGGGTGIPQRSLHPPERVALPPQAEWREPRQVPRVAIERTVSPPKNVARCIWHPRRRVLGALQSGGSSKGRACVATHTRLPWGPRVQGGVRAVPVRVAPVSCTRTHGVFVSRAASVRALPSVRAICCADKAARLHRASHSPTARCTHTHYRCTHTPRHHHRPASPHQPLSVGNSGRHSEMQQLNGSSQARGVSRRSSVSVRATAVVSFLLLVLRTPGKRGGFAPPSPTHTSARTHVPSTHTVSWGQGDACRKEAPGGMREHALGGQPRCGCTAGGLRGMLTAASVRACPRTPPGTGAGPADGADQVAGCPGGRAGRLRLHRRGGGAAHRAAPSCQGHGPDRRQAGGKGAAAGCAPRTVGDLVGPLTGAGGGVCGARCRLGRIRCLYGLRCMASSMHCTCFVASTPTAVCTVTTVQCPPGVAAALTGSVYTCPRCPRAPPPPPPPATP